MVEGLEKLHKAGFIHKDIKPDNYRIHNDIVMMIDFGLSQQFIKNGIHDARSRIGFEGSPFFSSINALQGYSLSRRDDLESLGYSILYMMNPPHQYIPWINACKNQN